MKPFALALLLLTAAYTPSFAQPATDASEEVVLSDTQEAFDKLKTLAGSWVGTITTTPVEPSVSGMFVQVSMRVTSRGNALAQMSALRQDRERRGFARRIFELSVSVSIGQARCREQRLRFRAVGHT